MISKEGRNFYDEVFLNQMNKWKEIDKSSPDNSSEESDITILEFNSNSIPSNKKSSIKQELTFSVKADKTISILGRSINLNQLGIISGKIRYINSKDIATIEAIVSEVECYDITYENELPIIPGNPLMPEFDPNPLVKKNIQNEIENRFNSYLQLGY